MMLPSPYTCSLHPFADVRRVAEHAAQALALAAQSAIARRGVFLLALSGGSSPLPLFSVLSAPEHSRLIPWEQTLVFWADERCVPRRHPDSNFFTARQTLRPLARARRVCPIPSHIEPEKAAKLYEKNLRRVLKASGGSDEPPVLDCVILGMGNDGHTASLFPHMDGLQETVRFVVSQRYAQVPHPRISLTLPIINAAREVFFLITGAEKHTMLHHALSLLSPPQLPVQMVRPHTGVVRWFVDKAAFYGNCAASHAPRSGVFTQNTVP